MIEKDKLALPVNWGWLTVLGVMLVIFGMFAALPWRFI